jgi:hypothetical protein
LKKVEITHHSEVSHIPDGAFKNCSSIKKIILPADGITVIGASAFEGCSSLGSINMPNVITSIGHHAFFGCTSLTFMDFSGANATSDVTNNILDGCVNIDTLIAPAHIIV